MPFLAGFFELLIHSDRACLGSTAHGKLHSHARQTEQKQAENIDQDESAAAVLTGHPRKLPYVSAADGTTGAQQNEAKPAAKMFTFVIHFIPPYLC